MKEVIFKDFDDYLKNKSNYKDKYINELIQELDEEEIEGDFKFKESERIKMINDYKECFEKNLYLTYKNYSFVNELNLKESYTDISEMKKDFKKIIEYPFILVKDNKYYDLKISLLHVIRYKAIEYFSLNDINAKYFYSKEIINLSRFKEFCLEKKYLPHQDSFIFKINKSIFNSSNLPYYQFNEHCNNFEFDIYNCISSEIIGSEKIINIEVCEETKDFKPVMYDYSSLLSVELVIKYFKNKILIWNEIYKNHHSLTFDNNENLTTNNISIPKNHIFRKVYVLHKLSIIEELKKLDYTSYQINDLLSNILNTNYKTIELHLNTINLLNTSDLLIEEAWYNKYLLKLKNLKSTDLQDKNKREKLGFMLKNM
ncbi:hypothetical protein ACTS9T_03550 [Empedobacter falsenii]